MIDLETSLEKARTLLQMKRVTEALGELTQVLSHYPDNYIALVLCCDCYLQLKDKVKIKEVAEKLVAAYPSEDIAHYYMALAYDLNKKPALAENHIRQAIAINPHDADFFGFLSALYIEKSDWQQGLDFANQGLEIEPENVLCLNNRTQCLTKLGRKEEIITAVEDTLSASPDNWYSHANVGWSKLETGDYKAAKGHFAESLRLNPNADYARSGMLEAMKASNFLYRWYLQYVFWLSKMNTGMQWAVLIGFVVGRRVIAAFATQFPPLYALVFLMLFMVYTSWIIRPLGDFVLMLNRFGRYVLSKDETIAGLVTGIGFITGLLLLLAGWLTDSASLVVIGLILGTVIIPIGKYFHEDDETRTAFIKIFTAGTALLAIAAIVTQFVGGAEIFQTGYVIAIVAFTWIFNFRQSTN